MGCPITVPMARHSGCRRQRGSAHFEHRAGPRRFCAPLRAPVRASSFGAVPTRTTVTRRYPLEYRDRPMNPRIKRCLDENAPLRLPGGPGWASQPPRRMVAGTDRRFPNRVRRFDACRALPRRAACQMVFTVSSPRRRPRCVNRLRRLKTALDGCSLARDWRALCFRPATRPTARGLPKGVVVDHLVNLPRDHLGHHQALRATSPSP